MALRATESPSASRRQAVTITWRWSDLRPDTRTSRLRAMAQARRARRARSGGWASLPC